MTVWKAHREPATPDFTPVPYVEFPVGPGAEVTSQETLAVGPVLQWLQAAFLVFYNKLDNVYSFITALGLGLCTFVYFGLNFSR